MERVQHANVIAKELLQPLTAAGNSWKWQLRDATGQWIEMGSTVSWATRGQIRTGKIIGSPEPGRAQVKDDKNGIVATFAERELTATMEASTAKKTGKGAAWYNEAMREVKEPKAVNIRTLAVETDTALSALYEKDWGLQLRQQQQADSVQSWSGSKKVIVNQTRRTKAWNRPLSEALTTYIPPAPREYRGTERDWTRAVTEYEAIVAQRKALEDEMAPLKAAYQKYHWTRAFLVTNGDGHIHSSMSCSTCYPTTRFAWLPTYSGANEDDIVSDAGERACTVCYPSAPVDVLSRPTKILTDEEREKIARAEAKSAKEAAQGLSPCPGAGTYNHKSEGARFYSPWAVCGICGQRVSITSTGKIRKHTWTGTKA